MIAHSEPLVMLYQCDARSLPIDDGSVQCCVTSPPYWGLRDYGVDGQLGLEETPDEYVANMVEVFREVRRVLRPDGTLWLNLGDSYAGSGRHGMDWAYHGDGPGGLGWRSPPGGLKPKDLVGIPWRVAFALQADGWYLRSDIIWHKPNPMPESVTDRPTKSHEHVFLLSKSQRYYYDSAAIREPLAEDTEARYKRSDFGGDKAEQLKAAGHRTRPSGPRVPPKARNKRDVWTVPTEAFPEAHFAVFPPNLVTPCILAGCPEGGTVLDPFVGSGTTAYVARKLGRRCVGVDLNQDYLELSRKRLSQRTILFSEAI